jgi:UDP-glucose 4-epimerase
VTRATLVIGGSSPLGRAIGARLTAAGGEVALTSRRGRSPLDVTDPSSVREVLEARAWDAVVYLATSKAPEESTTQLDGLRRTVQALVGANVRRLVFASSAAVYGTDSPTPRDEESPLLGASSYARLKIESERILRGETPEGFSSLALRIFNVWGPGFENSLVNKLAGPDRPPLPVTSEYVRDYVHSGDVARAVVAALTAETGRFRAVNVATGNGVSNSDLANEFGPDSYAPASSGAPSYSVGDTRLAEKLLRFEAHRTAPTREGVLAPE